MNSGNSESYTTRYIGIGQIAHDDRAKIERVARAICWVDGRDPEGSTYPRPGPNDVVILDVAIQEWQNYVAHAVAAIKAAYQ